MLITNITNYKHIYKCNIYALSDHKHNLFNCKFISKFMSSFVLRQDQFLIQNIFLYDLIKRIS